MWLAHGHSFVLTESVDNSSSVWIADLQVKGPIPIPLLRETTGSSYIYGYPRPEIGTDLIFTATYKANLSTGDTGMGSVAV